MLQLLYTTLFTFIFCTYTYADYNITIYKEPIITENLGTAYLFHEEWTTLHFIDLKEITYEVHNLSHHLKLLTKHCLNFSECNPIYILQLLQTQINEMSTRIETISSITTHSRNKRGVVNFVGSGLKFLFGTMDADDAEEISHTLDNIYDHSSASILLVKKQTTIVKNLISKIKDFEEKNLAMINKLSNDVTDTIKSNKLNIVLQENILSLQNEIYS